jgi:hypothetical protein
MSAHARGAGRSKDGGPGSKAEESHRSQEEEQQEEEQQQKVMYWASCFHDQRSFRSISHVVSGGSSNKRRKNSKLAKDKSPNAAPYKLWNKDIVALLSVLLGKYSGHQPMDPQTFVEFLQREDAEDIGKAKNIILCTKAEDQGAAQYGHWIRAVVSPFNKHIDLFDDLLTTAASASVLKQLQDAGISASLVRISCLLHIANHD